MIPLPDELISLAFTHLPPRALFTYVPLVCRRWYRVSRGLTHPYERIPVHLEGIVVRE
ncbi:hypothetical protein M427DRAFT_59280 [Gonapodya prolifera JEL478]|uniref:F-box domain-containing protein n=1 Tax=Gonapodya prolifera (strain JEL478) TaxID=1344416 RepID=A0A139A7V2_GONPJ|nr:hypothetical protein M427DRAFT_59280 [Gonapodya prolifera JEL478]|eukprot:KXS12758.1 hypothetical protein M427DRAFT_59280 [Gonapodya prolifera JEL478]